MNMRMCSLLLLMIVSVQLGFAEIGKNIPQIGYLYPAGGRQGSTVYVTAGGQFLRGAQKVYVSGDGVQATVVNFVRPPANLNREQRDYIIRTIEKVRDKRIAELPATIKAEIFTQKQLENIAAKKDDSKAAEVNEQTKNILNHPLFHDLENKSMEELRHISQVLSIPQYRKQPNRQISEMLLIKVDLSPEAKPGMREIRISSGTGLTNPVNFEVSSIPEILELEPNAGETTPASPILGKHPQPRPVELPAVFNGQIMPGDIDRFRFKAKAGQQVVIRTEARTLIPYLADAVPGWFQATVGLYNAAGAELAYADDYRFDPDPVLCYEIPRDGFYDLEIHDSIYRGREDFVYRISVGQTPFITNMFPLGLHAGEPVTASLKGWNLPQNSLELKCDLTKAATIQKAFVEKNKMISNPVLFSAGTFSEQNENTSNNEMANAQTAAIPIIINGQIETAGDVDFFRIEGNADDTIVAEIYARRLNSPMDSLLRLINETGEIIAWNDDHAVVDDYLHKDVLGLMTHHADSYLSATLPKTGHYYIQVTDSQSHGGSAYGYRLRISRPQPDFQLRATPSGYGTRVGTIVPITVYVLRTDGFESDIKISVKDPSAGFKIHGGLIPAGCDRMPMTLQVPDKAPKDPVNLELEGTAVVNGQTLHRPVIPAEDRMQAFLYRHLVPAESFLVEVRPNRSIPAPINLADAIPVNIPIGQTTRVLLKTPKRPMLKEVALSLYKPPAGITIENVSVVPQGLSVEVKAEAGLTQAGLRDNLIIQAFREFTPAPTEKDPSPKQRRNFIGVIPAIPIHVVSDEPIKQNPDKNVASIQPGI